MNVYVYQAALYCADCGEEIRADLTAKGKAPPDPDSESEYDSDDFPKGPYSDGGGEADTPQHCDACGEFLENPLTADGEAYVRDKISDALNTMIERHPPGTHAWVTWRRHYGAAIFVELGDDRDLVYGPREESGPSRRGES